MHNNVSNAYAHPFAKHDRWMHQTQNAAKRCRVNSQHSVYSKKNPEDNNLAEDVSRSMLNEGGKELTKSLNRMQKFNSNVAGSNAYF